MVTKSTLVNRMGIEGPRQAPYYKLSVASQATVNAYVTWYIAEVAGFGNVGFYIKNTHASKDLTYTIDGSYDKSNWNAVQAAANVAQGEEAYNTDSTPYRWYRLQVKSKTTDNASSASSEIYAVR